MSGFYLAGVSLMNEPGIIVGPIAWILGKIVNILFNIIYSLDLTSASALGITIILFTIFVRCLMLPIAYNQQKSMYKTRKVQPQINKLREKYKDMMDDPEVQKKISMETQKIYRENDVNPLAGCLPAIIQMPIFFGLYYIMRHPFAYIDVLNEIYTAFSDAFLNAAGTDSSVMELFREFCTYANIKAGTNVDIDTFNRILNVLSPAQVKEITEAVKGVDLSALYEQKLQIETFCGINLTETIGLSLSPKLLLPILSGATTFLSSWLMSRKNTSTDPMMKSQQKMMNITMPLIMAWFTASVPAGIGVYWITGNIVLVVQQFFLNLHFEKKEKSEAENNEGKKNGGKKK